MRFTFLFLMSSLCFCVSSTSAFSSDWDTFLENIKMELSKEGVDFALFDRAMQGVEKPQKKVVEKLKKQPELTFSFQKYRTRMVNENRIKKGQTYLKSLSNHLIETETKYGVPKEVVVALWGIESVFGKKQGNFKIIPALATLAYNSHRKDFFKKELIHAVRIVDEGHIPLEDLKGSWAGAMGQCQFMPSSFYSYAADGDGDGRKDIWKNRADVFASAANYLKRRGWQTGMNWGEAVTLTKFLPKLELSDRGLSEPKPLKEWYALGIAHKYVPPLKWRGSNRMARLYMPEGPSLRSYLVYENFDVILSWNNSSYFAFSVLNLADRLAGRRDL